MRACALTLLLCGCYDFNADLAAYCAQGHLNCPLPCPDGGVCTLAINQSSVFDMTLSGGSLYWAQSIATGSVWQKPLNGGEASPLVVSEPYPISVVADDQAVYWSTSIFNGSTINKLVPGSGARSTLAQNLTRSCRMRLEQSTLYWSNNQTDAGNTLSELALPNGTPLPVATASNLCRFAVTDGTLYWGDNVRDGGLYMKTPGGVPTLLVGHFDSINSVVVDSTSVYWSQTGTTGGVWRAMKDGSAPTQLIGGQPNPATVVTDGVSVYYATLIADGQVLKVSTQGGDVTVIAAGQFQPLVQAVDDQFVYWSTLDVDGGIYRAPK
jgi:hypothetical protein